jgi:nucleoid DNA-binding protein
MITLKQLIADARGGQKYTRLADETLVEAFGVLTAYLKDRKGSVRVQGLGTFKVVKHKSRRYRHPGTGQMCEQPPKTVVKFVPAKALKF